MKYRFILMVAALLLAFVALPHITEPAASAAQTEPVELVNVDGFENGCDPGINLAGFTVRYNTGPTTVKIRSIAWTDYLNTTTTIGPTSGSGDVVRFTINTPPDVTLPENTVVQFIVGDADFKQTARVAVNCTTGDVYLAPLYGTDGRLLAGEDLPLVIYPRLNADLQPYLEFWRLDAKSRGEPFYTVDAATLADVPNNPATNQALETLPGEIATLYKLTSGEYQLNFAPNEEGKVFVVIFDALSPTSIRRADYPG